MNVAENILAGQQVLWCAVFVLGLEFIFLAVKLKEDKTFLFLGANILLLSMMAGIDIWIIFPAAEAEIHGKDFFELWFLAFHLVACAYLIVAMWGTRLLVNIPSKKIALGQTGILIVIGITVVLDGILTRPIFIEWRDRHWVTSWLYEWVFTPYIFAFFIWVIYNTIRGMQGVSLSTRWILKLLVLAYSLLLIAGILDSLTITMQKNMLTSTSIIEFGILAMGIVGTLILTEKIIFLYTSQRISILKINEINGTQSSNQPLYFMGISATHVFGEIWSQVTALKRDSQSLLDAKLADHSAELFRIDSTRKSLEKYSTGLLEYSTSSRIGVLNPTCISKILGVALKKVPKPFNDKIIVSGAGFDLLLSDQGRLSRAIFEVIQNCFEASAEKIEIRINSGMGKISLCIEDDGHGCTQEVAAKINHPFFTTRKSAGALGLGMSIAEGIIRAHGGILRFYPKILSNDYTNGLLVNILLPKMGEEKFNLSSKQSYGECLLISDRSELISEVLEICQNLNLLLSVIGVNDKGKHTLKTSFAKNKFVILDDQAAAAWDRAWSKSFSFTRGAVYACSVNRFLRPLLSITGTQNQVILCEESIMAILA